MNRFINCWIGSQYPFNDECHDIINQDYSLNDDHTNEPEIHTSKELPLFCVIDIDNVVYVIKYRGVSLISINSCLLLIIVNK